MDKRELRHSIRQQKALTTAAQRLRWSDCICRQLLSHQHICEGRCILLFYPLPDEPDITPVIKTLHEEGKTVLLPVVTGPETMEIRHYEGEQQMESGALGTSHPIGSVYSGTIDIAVIPGVAFDRVGNRMGRGRGYYDRFLASKPDIHTIGVAFPFQVLDHIPHNENDHPMDEIITA